VDFGPDDTQRLLVAGAQRWVAERCGFAAWQAERQAGRSLADLRWPEMSALGWAALALPTDLAGLGAGPVDCALLAEALAPGLVGEIFLAQGVEAATLLAALPPGDWRRDRALALAAGVERLALADAESGSAPFGLAHETSASRCSQGWRLDGRKVVVFGAAVAPWFVVSAATADGLALFAVAAGSPGLVLEAYATLDNSDAADLAFDAVLVPATAQLCAAGAAPTILARVRDAALATMGGEAVGLMQRLLQLTIEHTRTRRQFGQSLAMFQVLRHRMVDMLLQIEATRSLTLLAALRLAENDPGAERGLAALKVKLGQAGRMVGQQAIQLHGAIGMTDELYVGHAFKRLMALDARWGNADTHLRRFAALAP
jgi:alkylation response protein AidB-like acyl-CoA dehydrogenase